MNLLFNLPRRPTKVLIAGLQAVIRVTAQVTAVPGSSVDIASLATGVPSDPRTMVSNLDLEPATRSYVSCPACFSLYITTPIPQRCTYRAVPRAEACDAKLFRTRTIRGVVSQVPVRKYLYQELPGWLARLLSRPGIEDIMDIAHIRPPHERGEMHDIWDAPALKKIADPNDSSRPFIIPPPPSPGASTAPEGRYIFALAIDGFNPYHMKEAKQSVTTTAIYMTCLNLPPHLRFLPENMYLVGVIPGPEKPSLDEINHALRILVDDLVVCYRQGVWYSRTVKYPDGRLVRVALGPVVSDLLAARQTVGFGSANARLFCHCCYLDISEIENLDVGTWPRRNATEHRAHAACWQSAGSHKERERIFKEHNVRWSELLRLEYWDPILFTVIESAHNNYLGLLQDHCRNIWGMNIQADDGDGSLAPDRSVFPEPSQDQMIRGWYYLNCADRDGLLSCSSAILWHMSLELDIRRSNRKKKMMAKQLLKWVRQSDRFGDIANVWLSLARAGVIHPTGNARLDSRIFSS